MIKELPLKWHYPEKILVTFWFIRFYWYPRPVFELTDNVSILGHRIHKGFKSDGASIPWFMRWAFSPMGPWAPAAILHDFLLSLGVHTRKYCAQQFYRAMKMQRMSKVLRKGFYLGVRAWDWLITKKEVFK